MSPSRINVTRERRSPKGATNLRAGRGAARLMVVLVGFIALIGCGDAPGPAADAPPTPPASAAGESQPAAKRPVRGTGASVILIVVDTLRADHLSHYGYERPTSPRIDDWAKRAARFERSYATAPWTLPSFGSILTGMSPLTHAAGILLPPEGDSRYEDPAGMQVGGEDKLFARLDAGVVTIPGLLRDAGYVTGAVVNNPFLHPRFGLARGFEDYDHKGASSHQIRPADEMVERALTWIDRRDGQPFFLMLHIFDPHMNYDASPPSRGRFTSSMVSNYSLPIMAGPRIRRNVPSLEEKDRRFIIAAYDEEIAFVDQEIGRFLRGLEMRGLTGSALIVLTADHGEELFDHGGFEHGQTMHEELLRVPLLLWGKGVSASRIDVPVSIMDIGPTILDALGLAVPPSMEGVSLWPAVRDGARPPSRPIFSERRGSLPERKSVVQWPYRFSADAHGASPELYDLAADPAEANDLAAQKPEIVALLAALLQDRFEKEAGRGRVERAEVESETMERLRALGYLD